MDKLVNELRNTVLKKNCDNDYLLMNSMYVPLKIDLKNYHTIQNINQEDLTKKILFVDGGNTILFESATFCVGFIRVGGIIYHKNVRIKRSLQEFYILVKEINGKYDVKTYPETVFNSITFDPASELLRNGLEKCNLSKIVSVVRRFAEIEYAYTHSTEVDYIMMDGTLEAKYPFEKNYLEKLYSKKNVCALSKTCTLTTKNSFSITKLLLDLSSDLKNTSRNTLWYYNPIVINNNPAHKAELYFVKLTNKTDYVFRFEVQKDFNCEISELLYTLANNSSDPIFLGYPYGLIDVDQYVRVSDDESRLLRAKLSVKLGKDWNEISKHLNSTNAHSILDKIKF